MAPLAAIPLDDIIPGIVGVGLLVVVPLVAMLLVHQRKMAELFHRGNAQPDNIALQLHDIQLELRELRARVDGLTIAVDSQNSRLSERLTEKQDLSNR
jgi:hypothetical protein